MKLFAVGLALACILALGDAQSYVANDAFLTDPYVRPIFTQIQAKSFPTGSNLTNWLPELKIWSDGHIIIKFYDSFRTSFQVAVAQISTSQIVAFTVKLNQLASQLTEYRGNIKDVGAFTCIRVENTQKKMVNACNYTGSSTSTAFQTIINSALDLVRPIRNWAMLMPHNMLVTRVVSQCHYLCSNHPYSDTPITESGTWITNTQLTTIFLQAIGSPSYVFVDYRSGAGSFQVSVYIPGLSVAENGATAPPRSIYSPPNPTSLSGPNLALIIPLSVIGGISFVVFVTLFIYHRCKTTRKDSSYSVVETTAVSNASYPAQDVPMDTFGSSPSPMLATAPTATVVPSNYAMPTYMVSSGAPQYYMVSSPGNVGMSPMYTQPVQGGYILTYMPAQTNQ